MQLPSAAAHSERVLLKFPPATRCRWGLPNTLASCVWAPAKCWNEMCFVGLSVQYRPQKEVEQIESYRLEYFFSLTVLIWWFSFYLSKRKMRQQVIAIHSESHLWLQDLPRRWKKNMRQNVLGCTEEMMMYLKMTQTSRQVWFWPSHLRLLLFYHMIYPYERFFWETMVWTEKSGGLSPGNFRSSGSCWWKSLFFLE